MRLLKTKVDASETHALEIQEFEDGNIPKYAILSHRWGKDELTLQDVERGVTTKDGFKKVQQCCSIAKQEGFDYLWIDTCCIDKTSSAELSEAINSMYLWYFKADRCYAYLADVSVTTPIEESEWFTSEWFTRGWTLQELLAPAEIYFLDKNWKGLGTKESLQDTISKCTGIPVNILSGADDVDTCSIAQRMSWAAKRNTKRLEDRAYCLLGIFGINMPLLYGEGERAFIRLQEEIMRVSDDHSLFAWKSPDDRGGLLATSPAAFEGSGNIIQFNHFDDSHGTLTMSSRGVHLDLQVIGWGPQRLGLAILHCKEQDGLDDQIAIYATDLTGTMERFKRVGSNELKRFNSTKFRSSQYPTRRVYIQTGRMMPTQRSKHITESNNIKLYESFDDGVLEKLRNLAQPEALLHAAQEGHQDDVWLMLTRSDIDINSKGPDKWPALFHAVNNGHETVVKILLARGASISMKHEDNYTSLALAAEKGHEAIVKLLLDRGADVDIKIEENIFSAFWHNFEKTIQNGQVMFGWQQAIRYGVGNKDGYVQLPIFIWAAKNQHEHIIQLLLDRSTVVDLKKRSGPILLYWAAMGGHKGTAKWLLDRGVKADPNNQDCWNGRTPLSWAAERGKDAIIKLLVGKGADIEAKDQNGRTPLSWAAAAERGDDATVELLVEKGAAIEAKDENGRTPLSWAATAKKGNDAIIKLLVKKGADIEAKDENGRTPLSWAAAEMENDVTVKLLVEKGADIEAKDEIGWTPLSWAVEMWNCATIELLVEKGADIEAKDKNGRTPLLWATTIKRGDDGIKPQIIRRADIEAKDKNGRKLLLWATDIKRGNGGIIKPLVEKGAYIEAKDEYSRTLLLWAAAAAAERRNYATVELLVEKGADIEAKDENGRTPLSRAATEIWNDAIVKLLVEKGADIEAKDENGWTPLSWAAAERENDVIMKLLVEKGADNRLL